MKVKDQYVEGKIQFIDKVCKEMFNAYPYYDWIAKHVVSQLEHGMQILECKDTSFNVFQPIIA